MNSHPFTDLHRNYRIYLSAAFLDAPCFPQVCETLSQTGLLTYYLPKTATANKKLEAELKEEMDCSDVVVLLVGDGQGARKLRGRLISEFEWEYAQEINKPVLAYFTASTGFGGRDEKVRELKAKISAQARPFTVPSKGSIENFILADLLRLLVSEPAVSCWVRSDIHPDKVESIVRQKEELQEHLARARAIIQQHETRLGMRPELRDQLLGPLVETGLRPNYSGQAYRFAVSRPPGGEIYHDRLEFTYALDRFTCYDSGVIYDRLLDLSWLAVKQQNFPWTEAVEWPKHLSAENWETLRSLGAQPDGAPWRLPRIEELMTLLTDRKFKDSYIDRLVFPEDVHWYWSATQSPEDGRAYYIETTQGQVLLDTTDHRNTILLCAEGKLDERGEAVHLMDDLAEDESELLRQANQSRRLYGVYLSVCASDEVAARIQSAVQSALPRSTYFLTPAGQPGARPHPDEDHLRRSLENHDIYILVIDSSAGDEPPAQVITELNLAAELKLASLLFHHMEISPADVVSSLEINADDLNSFCAYADAANLPTDILLALETQRSQSPGWMQKSAFDAINRGIEAINHMQALVDESEDALEQFIAACRVRGLRDAFIRCGMLTPEPDFGERTWFASRDNPIQRFYPAHVAPVDARLPILFEKVPNRFEPISQQPGRLIVYDSYLDVKWWCSAIKKTTFAEAVNFASDVSRREGETWRMPTIEEMLTLVTRSRGKRKYMDEVVFPVGRWFWTASRQGDQRLYIDYNYLKGCVGREDIPDPASELNSLQKKSIILVCGPENEPAPRPAKPGSKQAKKRGGKMIEALAAPVLLKTVDFLFDEAKKILAERRERRKQEQGEIEPAAAVVPVTPPLKKEEVIHWQGDESCWLEVKSEIEHQLRLKDTYVKNYHLAKEQYAKWTSLMVPPPIVHQLEEAENGIADTAQKLEKLLARVYGRPVIIIDN